MAWTNTAVSTVHDNNGQIFFWAAMVEDISDAKHLSAQLTYQASHDLLTGLVNRGEFEARLNRIIDTARKDASQHGLCYLDLDHFKFINNTCGHMAGDELLKQLSSLLSKIVRKRDTLARLGGDEFGILMEHCPPEQAWRVANELRETVQNFCFFWESQNFNVTTSVGVVPIDSACTSIAEILRAADNACYRAKENGRNQVHVYHPQEEALQFSDAKIPWLERLTIALDEDHFELFEQTITPLDGHTTDKYCELLVRLRDGEQVIEPDIFLPQAERFGLASRIDRWVLRHAFEWLEANEGGIDDIIFCSINLSMQSLQEASMSHFILTHLAKKHIPPSKICLEITESATLANQPQVHQFMRTLGENGCCFALDGFGNGLAAFSSLRSLPVHYLKINGGFVREICQDLVMENIIKSINDIGQSMNIQTIAEFAESAEIVEKLCRIGVNFAQGHYFGYPQSVNLPEFK